MSLIGQKIKQWKVVNECWHCKIELIWGGDHDIEEEEDYYEMVTKLSCPKCDTHVDVNLPKKEFREREE